MRQVARQLLLFALTLQWSASLATAQDTRPDETLIAARDAFIAARSDLAYAQRMLSTAQMNKGRLERAIWVEAANKPDLLEQKRLAADASRHFNALRRDVLKELELDPDYVERKRAVTSADEAFRAVRADDESTLKDELASAQALLAARQELTRYEAAAMALDPAIDEAKLEMNRAHDAATKLETHYRRLALSDPRLASAVQEIEHAKSRLQTARAAFESAQGKLADEQRRAAMREASRRADHPPLDKPEE